MKSTDRLVLMGAPRIGWCRRRILRAAKVSRYALWTVMLASFALIGCSKEPQFRENQLEWVKIEKMAKLPEGQHFDPIHHQDVADIMTAWFGTPDQPFFPMLEGEEDFANELLSMNNLETASGRVSSDRDNRHVGLYREHCAHCHGITGDGAGPTASFLDPYPRDFRLGKFKFKRTPLGTPPTREDLKTILVNGIPGTAMPSFRLLKDDELEALIDYVIFLSTRGVTERQLIASVRDLGEDLPRMVSLPEAKRISEILNPPTAETGEGKTSTDAVAEQPVDEAAEDGEETQEPVVIPVPDSFDPELVAEELAYVYEDYFLPSLEKWLSTLEFELELPETPEWIDNPAHELYNAKVELGQSLYFGQANCKQCHGETGLGDGQTNNYDDWTNDWLQVESLNPEDLESLKDYIQAGAFPPRPIMPRNLRTGVYRGGQEPADLFLRIKNGIEGTPMPASLTLNEDQIWSLVAYVRQLPYETISRPATKATATNDKNVR